MHGLDHLTSALASIAQNKVRSLLTTLGVIIGVMSVILLIALGESAQAYVQKEFAILGSNILIITPGKQETTGLFPITAGSNRKLTHEIAQSIKRKVPGVSGYVIWSAPQEVIHPLCWSEDHLDGTRDGKEASQAGRDRREAAAS